MQALSRATHLPPIRPERHRWRGFSYLDPRVHIRSLDAIRNIGGVAFEAVAPMTNVDQRTEAVLDRLRSAGYTVRVSRTPAGQHLVKASIPDTATTCLVVGTDLYPAACEVARRCGIATPNDRLRL